MINLCSGGFDLPGFFMPCQTPCLPPEEGLRVKGLFQCGQTDACDTARQDEVSLVNINKTIH